MKLPHNDVFLRALLREPVPYTPVWIMRQAGRYLPEYRAMRAKAGSFLTLCKTPELACEVTLQPLRRFPLDAAILFSDILTIPDAMGLGLSFVEGEGPRFAKKIRSLQDVQNLPIPDPHQELNYVMEALKLIKRELKGSVPLIGFSGSPFTLAAYMVEGGSSKDFSNILQMQKEAPEVLHHLLEKLAASVILYLTAQIEAGAEVVMIFDSWGGVLAETNYQAFSLGYIEKILQGLPREYENKVIPRIVYARGASDRLQALQMLGASALGLDEHTDLAQARQHLGSQFVLQGNFASEFLTKSNAEIVAEVRRILDVMQGTPHIFNLGHGITPDIDPEKLAVLINAVHECSRGQ